MTHVKLLILLLLIAPVAKADSYSFSTGTGEMDFQAPADAFQINQYTFIPDISYFGGVISADFYPIEHEVNYFVGYFIFGEIVAYPADFQPNDLNPYAQWPWDLQHASGFSGYDTTLQSQALSITTPEPSTGILVLLVGLLLSAKKLLWRN